MNIKQALKNSTDKLISNNIPSASLDAEILLLEALNRSRCKKSNHDNANRDNSKKLDKSWLYINNDYKLNKKEEKLFNSFINQRLKHEPVAYIINRKEFYGYDFYIDENVLIPRPETELIVEEVLKIIKDGDGHLQECSSPLSDKIDLIDIGTGSGCIIISILNELTKYKKNKIIRNAYANDISIKSIKIAKFNAKKYNLTKKIKFIASDFEKFMKKKFSSTTNQFIITANLPYVKNDKYKKLLPSVKKYEPKTALLGGENGLDSIERLIEAVLKIKKKCEQKIYVLIEADPNQMNKITATINEKSANANIEIVKDLSGQKRLVLLYC